MHTGSPHDVIILSHPFNSFNYFMRGAAMMFIGSGCTSVKPTLLSHYHNLILHVSHVCFMFFVTLILIRLIYQTLFAV